MTYELLVWSWFGVAAVTVVALRFLSAPYGRHLRAGWGPSLPSRWGWLVMELPAALVIASCFALRPPGSPVPWLMLGLWQIDYVHRALVFPFVMRGGDKPMPIAISGMGVCFNFVNGYLNGHWLTTRTYDLAWLGDPRFIAGVLVMAVGFAINLQSDAILRRLRAPGETGYKIPTGGLYRWISCPNYFGEIVEWFGWALLTWSLAGLSFAVWTAANLVPRALTHHRWYRERFADYPRDRRAIVPFIL